MTGQPVPVAFDPAFLFSKYDPGNVMDEYLKLLGQENRKLNLVSRETSPAGLRLLAAESLLPLDHVGPARFERYLDIGSGGGLPGIPILVGADIAEAVFLERTVKKSLALTRIAKALGYEPPRPAVVCANFEQFDPSGRFSLITLRLVKLTRKLLRKVLECLEDDGVFVFYSTPPPEIDTTSLSLTIYPYISGTSPTPKTFTILRKKPQVFVD